MSDASVVFLGTRGSMPMDGPEYALYGGATSCVLVRMGGENILLDAGTGLLRADRLLPEGGRLYILLSHAHADHVFGLPMFSCLFEPQWRVTIFATPRTGLSARDQVGRLMSEPLWPTDTSVFCRQTEFVDIIGPRFMLGAVDVLAQEGCHPGGCTMFRLNHGNKSVVYCTDFEHSAEGSRRLAEFAAGCDLLIYDATYSDKEYQNRHGWGHSTWEEGVRMRVRCGARRVALFHHDSMRDDAQLSAIEGRLSSKQGNCFFARCGEEVDL